MIFSKETVIVNKTGLHARPAATFVKETKKFSSEIKLKNLDYSEKDYVNGKSLIKVLSLALNKGCRVEICAEGDDAEEAVNALVELIEGGFGEL